MHIEVDCRSPVAAGVPTRGVAAQQCPGLANQKIENPLPLPKLFGDTDGITNVGDLVAGDCGAATCLDLARGLRGCAAIDVVTTTLAPASTRRLAVAAPLLWPALVTKTISSVKQSRHIFLV